MYLVKINHVNSEVGVQIFTGQPGQWIADFTVPTAKPLATGHRTSVNFDTWIIYSTRTIYLPSLKLPGQSNLEFSVAQGVGDWHDLSP